MDLKLTENRIDLSLDFFTRIFIQNPINGEKKPLSGLSLRLIAILLNHLSLYEPRQLPPRNELTKLLNVSKTSITDSLAQLQNAGFIYPVVSPLQGVVWAEPERGKEIEDIISQRITNQKKQRRFSGYFQINAAYNIQMDEVFLNATLEKTKEPCREIIKEKIPNMSDEDIDRSVDLQRFDDQLEKLFKEKTHFLRDD